MKRYRVLNFDFDARANTLKLEIHDEWDEDVKAVHRHNQDRIREGLIAEFGLRAADEKYKNFIDVGAKPLSVVAFHNKFANQIRDAFVIGAYYPALTGACALGERILNHLMLLLRDDYRDTPEYKHVQRKDSFDNWAQLIKTLESWKVLLPDVVCAFSDLAAIRNRTLHFKPEIDRDDRKHALKAIDLIDNIIYKQFGSFGLQPWFIADIPGAAYIRKAAEQEPFIRKVYLPNSCLVGPNHRIQFVGHQFVVHDSDDYPVREISDEEFKDYLLGDRRR